MEWEPTRPEYRRTECNQKKPCLENQQKGKETKPKLFRFVLLKQLIPLILYFLNQISGGLVPLGVALEPHGNQDAQNNSSCDEH
jgi:H+/gluconate symporter-like permease